MDKGLTIEPSALVEMLERREKFLLLDCRERWEYETARLEGSMLIPMREIPRSLDRIPKDRPVVVYCHAGQRSLDVASWLLKQGVNARSLRGGIDRWSVEIDPTVPRY
jgi:rhodanese-related sulfurtransferase